MDYHGFLELVQRRRTIRKFKPDIVPDDIIEKIIEAARYAPSGANIQPWEFLVIRKPELKEGIIRIIEGARAGGTASVQNTSEVIRELSSPPVFIMLLGDSRTRAGLPGRASQDDRKWQSVLISSLASAFLYMHLAATSLGLASRWQSGVERPDSREPLGKLLGLPDEMQIYDMMVVGYPEAGPSPKRVRDRKEMIHYDYCRKEDLRSDEQVTDFLSNRNR
jgi:5,6-dimethylbenzimidazole synthase